PVWRDFVWFLGLFGASWALQRVALGVTLGERIWHVRALEKNLRPSRLQPDYFPSSAVSSAIFLTTLAFIATTAAFRWAVLEHPLLLQAQHVKLQPFLPQGEDWQVLPFYYSMGGWPSTFRGHAVVHSLPYEKGPPKVFIAHIRAIWEAPDTALTYEGPRTPLRVTDRSEFETCLLAPSGVQLLVRGFTCFELREALLGRHLEEMRAAVSPQSWVMQWFLIENPAIPREEQAQGVFLRAEGAAKTQERFILITARGTNQAFILDTPSGENGEEARALFERAVRSLRVSDELGPGRAWVDRQIETVTPHGGAAPSAEVLSAHAALLLSKISVEPAVFDSYFLLGRTLLEMAREISRHQIDASAMKPVLSSLAATSAYAHDVAPDEPRTAQLQQFYFEAQRLTH
ncbi:MAG: hypothetical protein ACXWOH_14080, partial [Bdellovibrionota bacterium]